MTPATPNNFLCRSKNFAFIFCFLLAVQCKAQAPGFMGKRFSAGYGYNISPAFTGATPNGKRINSIHELYIDYAIGTKWLMGFSARLYKTIYDNEATIGEYGLSPENYYSINGLTLCYNFKYFKHNYVAPWGRYFMMSPVINIARTSYDPYMHMRENVGDHDTLYTDFGPTPQNFYHFDLMFGWGKTRIIAEKFTIDYGVNFQFWALMSVVTELDFGNPPTLTRLNYIEETHKSRVYGINRFNAFIKLGYLF